MHRTSFQYFCGCLGLLFPGICTPLIALITKTFAVAYFPIPFIVVCGITTVLFFVFFDRRVSKVEFLPLLVVAWNTWCMTGATFFVWTILVGYWTNSPIAMGVSPILAVYAGGISIPVTVLCVIVRKRIRPLNADNYIRCRVCEYRVDNLPGPRCPNCGAVIGGRCEVQT